MNVKETKSLEDTENSELNSLGLKLGKISPNITKLLLLSDYGKSIPGMEMKPYGSKLMT